VTGDSRWPCTPLQLRNKELIVVCPYFRPVPSRQVTCRPLPLLLYGWETSSVPTEKEQQIGVLKTSKVAVNLYRTRRFSSLCKKRCRRYSLSTIVTKLGAERQDSDKAQFILLRVQAGYGSHPNAYSSASWTSFSRSRRQGFQGWPLPRSKSKAKHEWYIHATHTLILTFLPHRERSVFLIWSWISKWCVWVGERLLKESYGTHERNVQRVCRGSGVKTLLHAHLLRIRFLTLILLTWNIWWAPNNFSKWRMGFNSVYKGSNVRRE